MRGFGRISVLRFSFRGGSVEATFPLIFNAGGKRNSVSIVNLRSLGTLNIDAGRIVWEQLNVICNGRNQKTRRQFL